MHSSSLLAVPPPLQHHHRPSRRYYHHHRLFLHRRTTATCATATSSDLSLVPGIPLQEQKPLAIYHHLQSLAYRGKIHRALAKLELLERAGIAVDASTFSYLLRACRTLADARVLHVHLRINSLDTNPELLHKLARTYAAVGSLEEARLALAQADSFDHPRSPHPWNTLLRGHSLRGGLDAIEVFDEMRDLGIRPNDYSFSCITRALAHTPSLAQTMKTHALMIKAGFLGWPSVHHWTSIMNLYFKCGNVSLAMKVFDEIPDRDVVVWGAAIIGFSHNGMPREAIEFARSMLRESVNPNSVVLAAILPALGELADRRAGQEVHGFVIKRFRDYSNRRFLMSGIINVYAKCGDLVSARRVFNACEKRHVLLWNTLMSGYACNDRFEKAFSWFLRMQQEGIKPDFASIIKALPICTKLRALRPGKEIHAYTLRRPFLHSVPISTSLITLYSSCGLIDYSCRMFNAVERKNPIVWTAMIDSFLRNGCPSNALEIFRLMLLSENRPNSVTLARCLSAIAELRALRHGKEVHGQVLRRNFDWAPLVAGEIINVYGICGEVAMARRVFDRAASKGTVIWTSIINAYGANGLYSTALNLFDQMLSDGLVPNQYTFDAVLSICKRAELPDEAVRVYDLMVSKYNLMASREHKDTIAETLTLAGRDGEARRFAKFGRFSAMSVTA